jgi:penicillin V acylase-like amidase (Ntn superfamily)
MTQPTHPHLSDEQKAEAALRQVLKTVNAYHLPDGIDAKEAMRRYATPPVVSKVANSWAFNALCQDYASSQISWVDFRTRVVALLDGIAKSAEATYYGEYAR